MSAVPRVDDVQSAEIVSHYESTELGNAKRLVDAHRDDLRRVAEWDKWLHYNGRRWELDLSGHVHRYAKAVSENILDESRASAKGDLFKWGLRSQGNSAINNMIALAGTEPGIPILVNQLDSDPWLLNVANGTLDLRTGDLNPHRRADLITKVTSIPYTGNAVYPTWTAFLERVLPDPEARDFLQRLVGYALTGLTVEHVLVLFIGNGANGKSTLTNTLLKVFGEYASPAPPRLLLLEKHSEHPTQIADLLGRRLVVSQEVQQGHRLDEELVKQLTGGDQLKARRMREDYWSFTPTHTLILAANHKPKIAGRDHAIWRRIRVIPFDVTIPDNEQDKQLGDKLQAELPGILAWAVQGCLAWQQDGLEPPQIVTQATDRYRTESDLVAMFIDETCIIGDTYKVRSTDLYNAYTAWCKDNGLDHPLSQKALAPRLEEKGFDRYETTHPRHIWWLGLGLIDPEETKP